MGNDRFFASMDVGARKQAWLEAETAIRGKAYLVKISDAGRSITYKNSLKGWKGWYALRNWDTWRE